MATVTRKLDGFSLDGNVYRLLAPYRSLSVQDSFVAKSSGSQEFDPFSHFSFHKDVLKTSRFPKQDLGVMSWTKSVEGFFSFAKAGFEPLGVRTTRYFVRDTTEGGWGTTPYLSGLSRRGSLPLGSIPTMVMVVVVVFLTDYKERSEKKKRMAVVEELLLFFFFSGNDH